MSSRLLFALTSLLVFVALAASLVFLLRPADAATFTVTKTADTADGACDSDCSLREAIIVANAAAGADTITLPAGTYTLTIPVADEEAGATGDLDITDSVTINGAGIVNTTVDGGAVDRVFHVVSGTVSISGVTIQNGAAANAAPQLGHGGGIHNASGGILTLTNSLVTGNSATGGGGGVRNNGTMSLTNSTVSDNTATSNSAGGGIVNAGTLTLTGSTVSGNTAATTGGITNIAFATVTITDSTVSGNTAKKPFILF